MQSIEKHTLHVDSVHVEFGPGTILQSAFITAETGKVTGLLGRNGSGKSCLFKSIMGGIKAQNLFVRIDDEPKTDYAHIGRRVKYLPQHSFIPPRMTLDEAFKLYGVDYDAFVQFDNDFHPFQRKQFGKLSSGAARIAGMFLVLMSDSQFCILDEPFSNISPVMVAKMADLIRIQKESKGIIVSDHLYNSIIGISDTLYLLRDGYTFPVKSREDLIRHGYILR